MGTQGFRRVTPTHLQALLGRYRRVLGELAFRQKQGLPTESLERARDALTRALHIYDATLDLAAVPPIRYTPPPPVSPQALQRALLSVLRTACVPLSVADIVVAVLRLLPEVQEQEAWLRQRLPNSLATLQAKGWARQSGQGWQRPPEL